MQSMSKFREIFEKSPIGILFYDKEGKLIEANQSALEIAGITSLDDVMGIYLFDNPHVASRKEKLLEKGLIKFQASLDLDNIKNIGFYTPRKSGNIFIDYIVSITDTGFLVQIQDITEHKKVEEHLEFQSNLFDNVNDAVIATDENFIITSWNDAAERIYGWNEIEVIGKKVSSILRSNLENNELNNAIKVVSDVGKLITQSTHHKRDGTPIYIEGNTVTLYDKKGRINGYLSVNRDITGYRKSEEEIKYQAFLLGQVNDAVIGADSNFKITYWNKGAAQMYGFTKAEALGKKSTELLKPVYALGEREKIINGLERYGTSKAIITTKHKNGTEVIVEANSTRLADDSGNTSGYAVIYRDITKRKKAEEQINNLLEETQQFAEELEVSNEELQATTEELHVSNEELQATSEELQVSNEELREQGDELSSVNTELRQSGERLLLAQQAANIGTFEWNIQTGVNTWTPELEAMYGLPSGGFQGTQEAWEKLVYFEDFPNIQKCVEHTLKTGRPVESEWRVIWPDGSIHWLFGRFKVFKDKADNPIRMTGVNIDITERKEAEDEIQKNLNLINGINKVFEESLTCETVKQVVGKCLEVAEELTGSEFGFIGEINENERLDSRELSPPGWEACTANPERSFELLKDMEIVSYWGRTIKEEKSQIVNNPDSDPDRQGVPEGHPPITSFLGVPLKQGGKTIGMIALANKKDGYDLEDKENIETLSVAFVEALMRKRAQIQLNETLDTLEERVEERTAELEEAYNSLKESELKAKERADLLDITHEAVFVRDMDDKISFWNKGAEELYEWTKKEAIGKNIHDLLQTEFSKPLEQIKADVLIKDKWNGELVHTKRDGTKINVLSRWSLQRDRKDKPIGFLEVNINITKRKKAEEQLKETLQELERSNRELQSFAYITSHDLQEPLRSIASYSQLLKRRYEGQLDEDADEFIDFMVAGAIRMKEQIQGLLDYSRVGTRGGEFNKFNAEDALNHALSNLKSSIDDCNAEVTHDSLPKIVADESQITRVFQNLIGNALKFRKEGVQPEIHINARKEDNEYIFSVQDNGIGLEEEYTDRIFEVFKRLHAIGEYEGAGIGLAIVKRIIDRHGGRVWVESKPGKGSIFYFSIPDFSID